VNPFDQTLEQINAFRDEPRSRTGMFAIGRRESLT
jgi:hypothetical protein